MKVKDDEMKIGARVSIYQGDTFIGFGTYVGDRQVPLSAKLRKKEQKLRKNKNDITPVIHQIFRNFKLDSGEFIHAGLPGIQIEPLSNM